jgi:CheY-like chemotaxis protein
LRDATKKNLATRAIGLRNSTILQSDKYCHNIFIVAQKIMHHHRIIVVDNDIADHELIRIAFERINAAHEVLFLMSGEELIDYLDTSEQDQQPSLIVLDYNMPGLNGDETLRRIKANPFTKDTPIVIYSTSVSPQMKKEMEGTGVLLLMEKGGNVSKLEEQARYFMELIQ